MFKVLCWTLRREKGIGKLESKWGKQQISKFKKKKWNMLIKRENWEPELMGQVRVSPDEEE